MYKSIHQEPRFSKVFKTRIKKDRKLYNLFIEAMEDFPDYRKNWGDHKLSGGMVGLRSLVIDDDCRLIYKETNKSYIFIDIGTHEQVYKK